MARRQSACPRELTEGVLRNAPAAASRAGTVSDVLGYAISIFPMRCHRHETRPEVTKAIM
jgi:hypothetical protein